MLRRLAPLKPYLVRYKKRFLVGFLTLVITQGAGITIPMIIKWGIDGMMAGLTHTALFWICCLLLGAALVKAFFLFWARWILIGISRDVEYDLRNDLFTHLMGLSPRYYTQTRTGDLMSKLTNDLNAVRNMVGPGIMYSANTLVTGIATIGLMLHLDWRLTLLTLIPLP